MIDVTNSGFGLLRALGPSTAGFIGFSLIVLFAVIVINRFIPESDGEPSDRRYVRGFGFIVWAFALVIYIFSAASMTASLRIPRSDVNATGVYQQMDANTR